MILHPVLTDLTGFSVSDQLIRVQRDIKVQVVVDHDLKRPALDTAAAVFIDRPAFDMTFGPEPVTVYPSPGEQFFQKFGCQLVMPFFGNVTQGVFQGELSIFLIEREMAGGGPADAGSKFRHFRQFFKYVFQFDFHCMRNIRIGNHFLLLLYLEWMHRL